MGYKEKNFIADEKPQSKRPGKRTEPEHEYLDTLGSAKERVADWIDRGLPKDAAYAKVAIDEIIKEIKNTDDPERLEELSDAMRDVQMNQENSKWIKDRKSDYYGRKPDPDEYIPEDEGNEVVNDKSIDAIKDNFTPPGAKDGDTTVIEKAVVTDENPLDKDDNGKVEPDEMADFEKSLTDFMDKNPKGREDIPARTRR